MQLKIISKSIYFMLIFISPFLVLSCGDSGTGSQNTDIAALTGKVTLEGQSDHSGVTVSLYRPIALDSGLVALNQKYPDVGIQISQENSFDHRNYTPVTSTNTSPDGSWNITNIAREDYHIVATHPDWGWRYVFNYSDFESPVNLRLNSQEFNGIYLNQTLKFNDNQISIAGNTVFGENVSLEFEGNNVLYFRSKNITFTLKGNVSFAPNSKLYLFAENSTSNVEILFDEINNLNMAELIVLGNVEVTLNRCNFNIRESVFRNNRSNALKIIGGSGLVENCVFENAAVGGNFNQLAKISCVKSIFYNNDSDAEIAASNEVHFSNNCFSKSDLNLEMIEVNGSIEYNNFELSSQNIRAAGISNISINNNHFEKNDANILTVNVSHQASSTTITANQNNFIETSAYVILQERRSISGALDALNNYWETTSEVFINENL